MSYRGVISLATVVALGIACFATEACARLQLAAAPLQLAAVP